MDIDDIHDAIHGISMMVTVLLDAQDSMQAPDADPSVFQMSREDWRDDRVCRARRPRAG
jgi:hypothetical protein